MNYIKLINQIKSIKSMIFRSNQLITSNISIKSIKSNQINQSNKLITSNKSNQLITSNKSNQIMRMFS